MATAAKGDTYYGRVATNYDQRRQRQPWWNTEHEMMRKLLATLPEKQTVLDVPMGTGRFMPLYNERKHNVIGIDISVEMLDAARTAHGSDIKSAQLSVGSAMGLELEDQSIDVLVSCRFLSDIVVFADAKNALAEFARVTRGHAILQLGQVRKGKGTMPEDDVPMKSQMSAAQNKKLLKDHGFNVVETAVVKSDRNMNSDILHYLCKKS